MYVHTEGVERVQTGLLMMTERLRAALQLRLAAVTSAMAGDLRSQYAGHSKTGHLAASVRTKTKAYKTSVYSYVIAGGGKRVPYANAFERGLTTTVEVPAHQRTYPWSKLGLRFSVRAHQMKMNLKAHGYIFGVLKARTSLLRSEVQKAVAEASIGAGLA